MSRFYHGATPSTIYCEKQTDKTNTIRKRKKNNIKGLHVTGTRIYNFKIR